MSEKEINIAIAEACGWKPTTDGGICWDCNGVPIVTPPDYCNNLNAMHNAEKVLSRGKGYNQRKGFGLYKTALAEVCDEQHPIDATARQRAEAFLRTIGKWEEAK